MFPVIKSDYWSSKDDESQPAQTRQTTTHASVVYAPLPQHAAPLMYSTAPVTIHHSPHSTYNNNNNANPSSTFHVPPPPPPPPYDDVQPHRSLEYTTVYDKPALDETTDADTPGGAATRVDRKRKRTTVALERTARVQHKPLLRRFKKSAGRGDGEASKIESGLIELAPLKASAIIDTFEEIEDGLNDSLQKEHSRTAKKLLKCGRLSVRTLKRLLIALVAVSAVYTAGTQLYDGTKLDEFASAIRELVFPPFNRSEPVGDESTSGLNATRTQTVPIVDRGPVTGRVDETTVETSADSERLAPLEGIRALESIAAGPEARRSPFKIEYAGVAVSNDTGGDLRASADGAAVSRDVVVAAPATSPATETDIVEVVDVADVTAETDDVATDVVASTAVAVAATTDSDDVTVAGPDPLPERNATVYDPDQTDVAADPPLTAATLSDPVSTGTAGRGDATERS